MKLHSLAALLLPACISPLPPEDPGARASDNVRAASLEASWKERLPQSYVFLERHGDYRSLDETLHELITTAMDLGLQSDGAPFALFFDDPGSVPLEELRARACLPVAEQPSKLGALGYDLLPQALVVYARVQGARGNSTASYPVLVSYLRALGWAPGAPIREIYLARPREDSGDDQRVLTEIQIPRADRSE